MGTNQPIKISSNLNKLYDKEKIINIICKNHLGEIILVEQVLFEGDFKNIHDIPEYIKNKNTKLKDSCFFSSYDNEIKKNIIFNRAKHNKYIINWEQNFYELEISETFKELQTNVITIICVEMPGELGGSEGPMQYIKILNKVILLLKIIINPYKVLEKHIHYNKAFINDVIYKSDHWPIGFICSDNIEFKNLIENRIMKKLGYKKKKKNWILEYPYFKYPHELI